MIEDILRDYFPREYGLNPENVHIDINTKNEPFTLTDRISCTRCHAIPERENRRNCNEEILKINNNGATIDIVNFEDYIGQFMNTPANIHDRCDRIMADHSDGHNKIVFCDLCCYDEKYVEPNEGNSYPEGKRAKARRQMEKSIEVLVTETVSAVNLLTYPERIFLFAWRDYNVPDQPVTAHRGDPLRNMGAMLTTPSNMAQQTTTHHQKANYDFTFMQVKYPSVYNW